MTPEFDAAQCAASGERLARPPILRASRFVSGMQPNLNFVGSYQIEFFDVNFGVSTVDSWLEMKSS